MVPSVLLLVLLLGGVWSEPEAGKEEELDAKLQNEKLTCALLREVWDHIASEYAEAARKKMASRLRKMPIYGYPRYRRDISTQIESPLPRVSGEDGSHVMNNNETKVQERNGNPRIDNLNKTVDTLSQMGEPTSLDDISDGLNGNKTLENEIFPDDSSSQLYSKDYRTKKLSEDMSDIGEFLTNMAKVKDMLSDEHFSVNSTEHEEKQTPEDLSDQSSQTDSGETSDVFDSSESLAQNSETHMSDDDDTEDKVSSNRSLDLWRWLRILFLGWLTDSDGPRIDKADEGSKLKSLFEDGVPKGTEGQREPDQMSSCRCHVCRCTDGKCQCRNKHTSDTDCF